MADREQQSQTAQSSSSSSSEKGSEKGSRSRRGPHLAETVGKDARDDRPAEDRPGTPEHLGSDRPYEGAVPEAEQQ